MVPASQGPDKGEGPAVLSVAISYVKSGLSVIPILPAAECKDPEKGKEPAWKRLPKGANGRPCWKVYQSGLPQTDELHAWFEGEHHGIAVVAGRVSGGLEVIDVEGCDLFEQWRERVEAQRPGLVGRLTLVRTPRPGVHAYYRCAEVEGSKKLAQTKTRETLIESKGEGGYVLAPGSPGPCHPSGRTYEHWGGPALTAIPVVTAEERAVLLDTARSFDQSKKSSAPKGEKAGGSAPGIRLDEEEKIRRARAYVAKIEPAISGQGGHDKTFYTACKMVQSFGLTEEEAFEILRSDYNPRCQPPWSEKELRHKVEDACKDPGPKGYLLDQARGSPSANGRAPWGARPEDPEAVPAPVLVGMDSVQAKPVEWLWELWIPRGCVTVLDGDPGLGKSALALDLAARVSRGWAMPPRSGAETVEAGPSGGVLLLSAEDDLARTIRPRLDAAGADARRIDVLEAVRDGEEDRPPVLPWDLGLVEQYIRDKGIVLVVVDPLLAYLDSAINSHHDQEVRRCLHRLKLLAERTGVAIFVIRHLNKETGGPALYRGGGSIGIIGAARSALLVGRDPSHPDTRVLAMNKSNLGPTPASLTYGLEAAGGVARIAWGEETTLTADDILGHAGGPRKKSVVEQCAELLRENYAGKAISVKELTERCQAAGFSETSIKRARALVKAKAQKSGFEEEWMVFIPGGTGEGEEGQDGQVFP
jgi:hypothetical protein